MSDRELRTLQFSKDAYEHVGQPVYFSHQTGAISSNHNMSVTYCGAI